MRWLRDLVDIDTTPEDIALRLTLSGTKLESIHRPGESIDGVVVAEVKAVVNHPDADNLTLVDVELDAGGAQRVVCGARNFGPGDRVPLARVGAKLPGMVIGERKIRGQVSQGMLCSGAELGVSRDHTGILVLPPDSPVGEEVVTVLGLDDVVLEFEITPNRPDLMGMLGIAREVAALLGTELKLPPIDLHPSAPAERGGVEVQVQDRSKCPRYVARYMSDVKIEPSPGWLLARLLAAGVRPISNIVDVTNYVLVETGHPLHAFDAAKIAARTIAVRAAREGEMLTTLDGVERRMDPDDLVIADPTKPLAIAGIMGGENSEVSETTRDVILESAYFDPVTVGRTSRRLGLRTEASARFERGADVESAPFAAARAARLIAEIAGGRVDPEAVDFYPRATERRKITLRPGRTIDLLGYELTPEEQAGHLSSIGIHVSAGDDVFEAEVPTFRPDLSREVDLVEEVARLAGFERLPASLPPGLAGGLDPVQRLERRLRVALAGYGLREAWTTSFASLRDLDALGLPGDHPARTMIELANPMSDENRWLRTSLLPTLLRAAANNLAHRTPGVALFEIGHVYQPVTASLPAEPLVLGAVLSGLRRQGTWRTSDQPWDFFSAKGILEALCAALGVGAPSFSPVSDMPWHPTRAAAVSIVDVAIGTLGELHPEVCDRFDLAEGTIATEMQLDNLFSLTPERSKAHGLARFPGVYMDLAVVVDEDLPARTVELAIEQAGAPEVVSVRLFDLYRGEQVPEGKKSLAYALEMRRPDATMTDGDALLVRERIVSALLEQFGAGLRS
jgi:phenylalanyl-tRNA synthetase beta chain